MSARLRSRLVHSVRFRRYVRALFRRRLTRPLGHLIRSRMYVQERILIHDFDDNLAFHCILDEHIGTQIYWRGVYSWGPLRLLDRFLQDGMFFVDIGANQGEYTLFAAKRLPTGQVLAFEPMSRMAARLRDNIDVNGFANVVLSVSALADRRGVRQLYWDGGVSYDGSVNEGTAALYPAPNRSKVELVPCTTLDHFLAESAFPAVDVIKLDVEGAEIEALRGARETLRRDRPMLVVEADQRTLARANASQLDLLRVLSETHDVSVITNAGTTVPVNVRRLRDHENFFCVPR